MSDHLDDSRELVEHATRGDRAAVEGLLERFLPELREYVRRRAGRALLAKESGADLVQSVCRELFEDMAQSRFEYRGEAEFRRWLYGAALLKIEGRWRHWRADMRDLDREAGDPFPGQPEPADFATPSGDLVHRERDEHLRAALAELPEPYRSVVVLAHVEGLSHQEIAERLSISESHSRVLLSRALARLATLAARLSP